MEPKLDEPVRTIMESLRLSCERHVRSHQHQIDATTSSFNHSLSSIQSMARDSAQSRGEVLHIKARFREAEDDLVKAISAKNRKEAKRIALMDSLMARKSVVEELRRSIQLQRAKRDEYDEILSRNSSVSEEMGSQNGTSELQEAISWYSKVLGFRIEGGHGVKFSFRNISITSPDDEFSFTIRHADDSYSLLECDPQLDDIKELVCELNRTNDLFKFARIMRQKFQEAAKQGLLPRFICRPEESSIVSASAPAVSMSTVGSDSSTKKNEHRVQGGEADRHSKKQNMGKSVNNASLTSPGSVRRVRGPKKAIFFSPESVRRSSRVVAKK